ncbi:RidA family protein [Xanthomonas sacchari]|uniref:RidA family protein n=1 Tax=Xanthomonas sacchari TaxID=56458 RepID=UPI0031F2F68A
MTTGAPVPRQAIQPPALFSSRPWGFSQVVISEPGRMVSIAGQVAWDAGGRKNAEGLEGQFRQALKQVCIAVEAAGGTSGDIQNLRIYIPNLRSGSDADVLAKVLVETFGSENPPASSWIGVQALAQPEYLVEVEAMAVIPVK